MSSVAHGPAIRKRAPAAKRTRAKMHVMRVDRWDARCDGLLTEAALQHKLEALGYAPLPRPSASGAIASARIHPHERAEAILAGLMKVTIDGESVFLTAGDIVFIPGGATRRVEVVGTSPVHCLEAVMRIARG